MQGMSLDIKKKFSCHSDRVKSIDLHTSEPWILVSLYGGQVQIYNYETETTLKQFEITDQPVRTAKFIVRKQWMICGADDMQLRVYNYNTTELIKKWEGHSDYIRSIAVHPVLPYILTSSDDMTIKLWDWDKNWQNIRTFEGHTHYVMKVVFNPKDPNTFASASLDKSVKVWGLATTYPHFTLEGKEGHLKGVNTVEYYPGADKPYLVTGSDDKTVKIWDYQTKACVQTLEGHQGNVSSVVFHPELPIIISASEDGYVRLWNANTYRLEKNLNYGLDRAWCISCKHGSNNISLGYDNGTILLKMGREVPAASMEQTGKIIFARKNELITCNVRSAVEVDTPPPDGEPLPLTKKELASSEFYPQMIEHNPNGRLCCVYGDGEYTIYMTVAWRNKTFGSALEFVWGRGKGQYAVREQTWKIKIYNDFEETTAFRPDFVAQGLFGGVLLGVRSDEFLCLYDWNTGKLIKQIDVVPKDLYWSENGDMLIIACENSFYLLKYNATLVNAVLDSGAAIPEDGIEDSFNDQDIQEIPERVRTGKWVGDCFIYTNSQNKLNYCVGTRTETVAHLDRQMYLLGYLPRYNRVFLIDKSLQIISYTLHLSIINYQTAVLRRDFQAAEKLLPKIEEKDRTRIAHFLESQGHKKQALKITMDLDHKFDLAIQLGELNIAKEIAEKDTESDHKWKQLAALALTKWDFGLAELAMWRCEDHNGLLLLYTSLGNAEGMERLGVAAVEKGKHNVALSCFLVLGRLGDAVELLLGDGRFPEAALFARTYIPSEVPRIVELWRKDLAKTNPIIAQSLANPTEYPNLFPNFLEATEAQKHFRAEANPAWEGLPPAQAYLQKAEQMDRDLISEFLSANKAQEVEVHEDIL
eukprot:TRINITY_DN2616_c0_g1_i1.p1 TRINITY_DN2616_c0_g1~~TRINITY_DN2616_c0_g1_i1.p1  ORF type:complete len:869 (-),score=194.40 TRINITY_DN2616_c0_g1_i1:61-2667(-)